MLGNTAKRLDKIADMLGSLALEVSKLRSDVNDMMYRQAAPEKTEIAADPVAEKLNKMFADGLDELMSYDGKKRSRGGADDGEE